MIDIKFPKKKSFKEIQKFFINKKLKFILEESKRKKKDVNQLQLNTPYPPSLKDLYRLYQFIILNKRTTVFEFGSGWSSLIFYISLNELKKKHLNDVKKLRRNNPFELFILENEKKYLNISKKRILKFSKNMEKIKVHYSLSDVEMILFENRIATQYIKLPVCNPDFIYVDGPDQYNIKKNINGINLAHKDLMPMISDILKFEYFFTPGTIILCDGRGANAQFLRDHFRRKWKYKNDIENDQHIFWLQDDPIGKYNRLQLKFYGYIK